MSTETLGNKSKKLLKLLLCLLFTSVIFAIAAAPAAAVNHLEISPENPVVGDVLEISGEASPGEEVSVLVTFEQEVPVKGGKYKYKLNKVEILNFKNSFSVRAENVEDLDIKVKKLIWLTKSSKANENGAALVSQSRVPPGNYMLRIEGDAEDGASSVNLEITALQTIKADSSGKFSYTCDTASVPPGDFEVTVDGSPETITLQDKKAAKQKAQKKNLQESTVEASGVSGAAGAAGNAENGAGPASNGGPKKSAGEDENLPETETGASDNNGEPALGAGDTDPAGEEEDTLEEETQPLGPKGKGFKKYSGWISRFWNNYLG